VLFMGFHSSSTLSIGAIIIKRRQRVAVGQLEMEECCIENKTAQNFLSGLRIINILYISA
jgi:hypothetical protein